MLILVYDVRIRIKRRILNLHTKKLSGITCWLFYYYSLNFPFSLIFSSILFQIISNFIFFFYPFLINFTLTPGNLCKHLVYFATNNKFFTFYQQTKLYINFSRNNIPFECSTNFHLNANSNNWFYTSLIVYSRRRKKYVLI